jgi:hypothetical protein
MSLQESQPKTHYEGGSSNEHKSQEGKQTKCNQYGTLPDLIRYVGCTSQLQWITRKQTSVHKKSKQATQTHFKPKLLRRKYHQWIVRSP